MNDWYCPSLSSHDLTNLIISQTLWELCVNEWSFEREEVKSGMKAMLAGTLSYFPSPCAIFTFFRVLRLLKPSILLTHNSHQALCSGDSLSLPHIYVCTVRMLLSSPIMVRAWRISYSISWCFWVIYRSYIYMAIYYF